MKPHKDYFSKADILQLNMASFGVLHGTLEIFRPWNHGARTDKLLSCFFSLFLSHDLLAQDIALGVAKI